MTTSQFPEETKGSPSKEKPLAEQQLHELFEDFELVKDLTFVFLASSATAPDERGNAYGPEVITALALVSSVSRGAEFLPPFQPKGNANSDDATVIDDRISQALEARVQELQSRAGVSFVVLWAIAGCREAHLRSSTDWSWDDVRIELISFFSELLYECII